MWSTFALAALLIGTLVYGLPQEEKLLSCGEALYDPSKVCPPGTGDGTCTNSGSIPATMENSYVQSSKANLRYDVQLTATCLRCILAIRAS